jgi:hypothetical protein
MASSWMRVSGRAARRYGEVALHGADWDMKFDFSIVFERSEV